MALLPFSGSLYGGGGISAKNGMLDSASSVLGINLGDRLSQQMKDEEEERKKKLLQMQRETYPSFGPGTGTLFGALSVMGR